MGLYHKESRALSQTSKHKLPLWIRKGYSSLACRKGMDAIYVSKQCMLHVHAHVYNVLCVNACVYVCLSEREREMRERNVLYCVGCRYQMLSYTYTHIYNVCVLKAHVYVACCLLYVNAYVCSMLCGVWMSYMCVCYL